MTTTPKGFTQIDATQAPDGPTQINGAELFLENLIDPTVATASALPASGNWVGRTIFVQDVRALYTWGSDSNWHTTLSAGGTATFGSITSGQTGQTNVTFPFTFPGTPAVVVTPQTTAPSLRPVGYSALTATGFTIYQFNGSVTGAGVPCTWLAIYRV